MTGLAVFSWFSSMKDISSVSLASLKFVVCMYSCTLNADKLGAILLVT